MSFTPREREILIDVLREFLRTDEGKAFAREDLAAPAPVTDGGHEA